MCKDWFEFWGIVYTSRIGQVDVSTIDCYGTIHHFDAGTEDSLRLKRLTLE